MSLPIHLDPKLNQQTARRLVPLLAEAGALLAEPQDAALRLVPTLDDAVSGEACCAFINAGPLSADHAAAFRATPPGLILSSRDGDVPAGWEIKALVDLLSDRPLFRDDAPPVRFALKRKFAIQAAAQEASRMVREWGGGSYAAACAADVMHEIAANALLVAPAHPDGTPKYALQRDSELDVATEDGCEVFLWAAHGRLFLSAVDRFGRLTPAPVARAVSKLGQRAQVDVSGGGAGLGLRRILEQSDLVAIRVHPGLKSEMTCAIDIAEHRRRSGNPKSVLFVVSRGLG